MVSDLGGSLAIESYGISFYCIGNALTIPLGKPEMTRLSQSNLFTYCLLLFAASSLGCALSTSYAMAILYRLLQGAAAGPLLTLITTYYIPRIPDGSSQRTQLLLIVCFSVAPLLGASIGGVIGFNYNWRTIFYGTTLICTLLSLHLGSKLSSYNTPTSSCSFDKLEYFFYFIGVLFLPSALVTGQQFDWFRSSGITLLVIIGGVSLVCFLVRNFFWSNYPIIDFKLLKNYYISGSAIIMALILSAYFGSISMITGWLFADLNYTPNWIALLFFIMALGICVRLFPSFQKYDPRIQIIVGVICFIACCFYSSWFNWDIDFNRIVIARVLLGLVMPIFLPPLLQLMYYKLTDKMLVESINFFHVIRVLASALGVGLYHILWQRHEVFYHLRLGGALTPLSDITRQFQIHAKQFNFSNEATLEQLNVYLNKQAASLALNDCFYAIGWLMVVMLIGIVITFFFKSRIQL